MRAKLSAEGKRLIADGHHLIATFERVHVGTPVEEVEAEIRRRVNVATDPRWTPEKIEEALRFARWEHAKNRALYNMVA